MNFKTIKTSKAPEAIGPYSQAVEFNGLIYTSGQIPLDPVTQKMTKGDISNKTKRCLENIAAILEEAGSNLNNVVKTTIFLTNLGDFAAVNEVYRQYFKDNFPARSCVEVKALPKGAEIEIEAVAIKSGE